MADEYLAMSVVRKLALIPKSGDDSLSIKKGVLRDLIKMALKEHFDEEWYTSRYKDVADAVKKGAIPNGLEHYAAAGVFEGRIPYPFAIDELHYLNQHRDVARALKQGPYKSAAEHFYAVGFVEGRVFQLAEDDDATDGIKAETAAAG